MTSDTSISTEHDKQMIKLPWLVNGTLDATEVEPLREHIASCVECQSELEMLSSVNRVIKDAPLNQIDTRASLHEMRNRIAEEPTFSVRHTIARLKLMLKSIPLGKQLPAWGVASLASLFAVFLLIQQTEWMGTGSDDDFRVLSSSERVEGFDLNIKFDTSISAAQSEVVFVEIATQFGLDSSWQKSEGQNFQLSVNTKSEEGQLDPVLLGQIIEALAATPGVLEATVSP